MQSNHLTATRERILVALTLGLITAVVWTFGVFRPASSQAPIGFAYDSLLNTTNRPNLKVCVDSKAPEVTSGALKAKVDGLLGYVKAHPHFGPSGLAGTAIPQVDVGCPTPPRITEPGFDPKTGDSDTSGIRVDTPSAYRLYVFVVPGEQFAPLSGGARRWVPQEGYCIDQQCSSVSEAVYLTPADVSNAAHVTLQLADAAGLRKDLMPPTP